MKNKRLQKQKEKYQKKIARKPKLSREMIRASVISMVIVALFCIWISDFLADKYTYFGHNLLTTELENLDRKITTAEEANIPSNMDVSEALITSNLLNTSKDGVIDKLNFCADYPVVYYDDYMFLDFYNYWLVYVKHSNQLECSSYKVVFDLDGNILADGSSDIYQIIVHGEHGDPDRFVRMCRLDYDGIDSVYPGLSKKISDDLYSYYAFDLDESIKIKLGDIYYNDVFFIPSSLEIVKESADGKAVTDVLATYDLSDCDFSKLTKLDTSDPRIKTYMPMTLGAREDNPSRLFFEQFDDETLTDYVKSASSATITDNFAYTNRHFQACKFTTTRNGSYVIASFINLDFYRDFKDVLVIFYIIMAIIALIIGAVAGYIKYNKSKLPYEIDSYRRNTTNSMAHDLKTPLMAISGYAENIVAGENLEENRQSAENILESVRYMDQMIVNILELSKLENNNIKLEKTDVDLNKLINKCLKKYEQLLEKKNLTINMTGEKELKTDDHLMERLIDNLLSNAIKYGSKKSELSIDITNAGITFKNQYDTEISVDIDSLTKPFVKGDNARGNVEGNGLGLSIAQNIADVLGMTLSISAKDKEFTASINY